MTPTYVKLLVLCLGLACCSVMVHTHAHGQWTQLGMDIDGEAASDRRGASVSLSADGSRMAVGATGDDGTAFNAGNVRVYEWDGTMWGQLGNDIDGEAGLDQSGSSVSLSSSGDRVAIGASDNDGTAPDAGHVRVYEWNGTTWGQLGNDIDGEAADDRSGHSVSLSSSGDRVAIGARLNDGGGTDAGHVRVYEWNGTTWLQLGTDIDGASLDQSGRSVSLSSSGDRVAIGAPSTTGTPVTGSTRVYEWNGTVWAQLGNAINGEAAFDQSGWSVSLSSSGDRVAIGAPNNGGTGINSGHVQVYEWNGTTWGQMGNDIDGEAAFDHSGQSVSLSSNGGRVAIGAHLNSGAGANAGHVRVYEWNGTAWVQLANDIDGEALGDHNGFYVSISSNGDRVAMGAQFNDEIADNAGHARVYELAAPCDPPAAVCQDISVELDLSGNASIVAADVDNGSTADCGLDNMSLSQSSFTCADLGLVAVTLTVIDVNMATATCNATVTVSDGDADGDGTGNCSDVCPLAVDGISDFNTTTCDCDPGFTPQTTMMGGNTVITGCTAMGACADHILTLTLDAFGSETTWQVIPQGGGVAVASGGPYMDGVPGSIISETVCLADGCYELIVSDAGGDGITDGGYTFTTLGGQRIIDADGMFMGTSSAPAFCTPIGDDTYIASRCDKVDYLPTEQIIASQDPAVAAEFGIGDQTDDGYQFWLFDPHGTYNRRVFFSNGNPQQGSPPGVTAAQHLRFGLLQTLPVPSDLLLNIRVRARANGVYQEFGPACRFKVDVVSAACPQTKLIEDVNHPLYSCGVTGKVIGGSDKIAAQPVAGANRYQFEFTIASDGYLRRIASHNYALVLGAWTTNPLEHGKTYDVRVRASFDNGANYCPWGDVCMMSTAPLPPSSAQPRNIAATGGQSEATVTLWPNPNRGDVLNVRLSGLDEQVETATVELFDAFGKRVANHTLATQRGQLSTVVQLNSELANGLYIVNLTAGEQLFTDRLVIQK